MRHPSWLPPHTEAALRAHLATGLVGEPELVHRPSPLFPIPRCGLNVVCQKHRGMRPQTSPVDIVNVHVRSL
jgi:hypothetical protein